MSDPFSKHLTDQQKIDAVDELYSMFGEGLSTRFKHFLFKVQGAFLVESNQMCYDPTEANNNIDALYEFFKRLEQNKEGGNNE